MSKARAIQQGRHQGRPFTGSKHDRNGNLVPDGELVSKIRDMMSDGLNPLQIAMRLEIPWSTMYRLVEFINTLEENVRCLTI